jgi:hypothetical protein
LLFVEPFLLFVLLPIGVAAAYGAGRWCGPTAALAIIVATSAVFYAPNGVLACSLLVLSLCCNLAIGLSLSGEWQLGALDPERRFFNAGFVHIARGGNAPPLAAP